MINQGFGCVVESGELLKSLVYSRLRKKTKPVSLFTRRSQVF